MVLKFFHGLMHSICYLFTNFFQICLLRLTHIFHFFHFSCLVYFQNCTFQSYIIKKCNIPSHSFCGRYYVKLMLLPLECSIQVTRKCFLWGHSNLQFRSNGGSIQISKWVFFLCFIYGNLNFSQGIIRQIPKSIKIMCSYHSYEYFTFTVKNLNICLNEGNRKKIHK
jgi:hypothetical protein